MAVNLGRARPTGTNHTIQNSFHPFRRIGALRSGNPPQQRRCGVPTAAERTYAWLRRRRAPRHTVGPNSKNLPKMRFKEFVKLTDHTLPATIRQVLKVKRTQRPETEVMRICRNL
jgi:hypothetical protein